MEQLKQIAKFSNTIELRVLKNGVELQKNTITNLVTNTGQTAYIDGGFPSYIALGTGSLIEEPTITSLDELSVMVAGSWIEVGSIVVDILSNTISRTFKIVKAFPVEKDNKLYSEIGIVDNKQNAFTYARLRDSVGQPTTITVLKDEQLEVTYTFTVSMQYKHVDDESGYTCYLHNIPAPHRSRNAQWSSSNSENYFRLFNDSLDRLEAGLPPTSFSGSRKNGRYVKMNNKIEASVVTAIGTDSKEYTGLFCSAPSTDSDFSFSILFDSPKTIDQDAFYSFSITLPYLGA